MIYRLYNWQCFELDSKDFGRVRMCVGSLPKGTPHMTGDVVETDSETHTVMTSLGNCYELSGPAGLTASAQELWARTVRAMHLIGVLDVSEKVLDGIQVMDGGVWSGEQS